MSNIKLVKDTITYKEIEKLSQWLLTNPRLTKGEKTDIFQQRWSAYLQVKHCLFVSSGSSANLAAFYSLILTGKLKNKKCILPAVSWSTTVAPAIQLGLEPILCDCNLENYGLDVNHLNELVKEHNPSIIVTCNVLGFSNDYDKILEICKSNNIFLIEDSCEAVGTVHKNNVTGTFGDISTFSFYYGHHMSTIEGGMICTDNEELATIITSIRCHGWDRDLPEKEQRKLRKQYNIDDFKALYTFYYPGFNMRCSDLQAFIGINQLNRLNEMNEKRYNNFKEYRRYDKSDWAINENDYSFISNMAYPVVTDKIKEVSVKLTENNVEHRPLICGSIGMQPFWVKKYGIDKRLKNARYVHENGIYVPNNPDLTNEEIKKISSIIWGE